MNYKQLICILAFLPLWASAQEVWSLEKCVQYALENNIQIKQNKLQSELSRQTQIQQYAEFLPTVNAQGTNTYNFGQTIDPFTNQFAQNRVRSNQLFLSANMTLFNGFQNWNSAQQSKLDYQASLEDTEKMQNDVSLNIANAYLQILFGKELLKNAVNQYEISKLQLERLKKLYDVGQLAKSNLLDIEAQLANDDLRKVNAENTLTFSYLQLFQLLQLEPGKSFEIEVPAFGSVSESLLKGNPTSIYNTAVDRLPEIKAQELRLKSAEKARAIAYGSLSPRLTLGASYGSGYSGNNKIGVGDPRTVIVPTQLFASDGVSTFTVFSPQQVFDDFRAKDFGDQLKDNLNKSISFSLIIPIFNGLATQTNIKRAVINNANQKLQLDASKNQLQQTIQRAYNDAIAALKQFQAAERLVNAQAEAFKYAEIRYQQNLINSVEYTDAKLKNTNAENDLVRAKYDYIFKTKVLDFYRGEALTLK